MRVTVLTDDFVGPIMAGSGLRAWELARVLRRAGHTVCLNAATGSTAPTDDGPELVAKTPWRWAEAIVSQPWSLPPRAFLGRRRIVVDGITPLLAELDSMPGRPEIVRRRRTAAARLPLALARADAVLVAGEAQRRWWQQRLGPRAADLPLLEVPFGIAEHDPLQERDEVAGIPPDWAIVLWWGGVWPWLDLDTLLAARARLGDAPLSLVVPTAPRPGTGSSHHSGLDLGAAATAHGLRHPQLVALEEWVPYETRHRLLHRTSLLAVLHHPGEEAELSFRTRALDGLWAGVPLLLSEGGEVARLTREHGWGAVVPPHDPRATAAALELMLSEQQQLRCREAIARCRDGWRWSRVAAPLVEVLPQLPRTARSSLLRPALRAALTLLGTRSAGER